jgi:hypothetical protein
MASPLEIVLRTAGADAFARAVDAMADPKRTFLLPPGEIGGGWTSPLERPYPKGKGKAASDEARGTMAASRCDLLGLALILGKTGQAVHMVRRGWAPRGYQWGKFRDDMEEAADRAPKAVAALAGLPEADFGAALDWVDGVRWRGGRIDDSFEPRKNDPLNIRELRGLLERGADVDGFCLYQALLNGDAERIGLLLENGASPNALVGIGVPLLARIDSKRLTPESLQACLDAGAWPGLPPGAEFDFGDGMMPSPLYQWAFDGRLDLIAQAVERAAGPVPVLYEAKDGDGEIQTWCPLLAVALSRGHAEIADWLISKGASLDHLDDESGDPCGSFASAETMARLGEIMAERAEREIGEATPVPEPIKPAEGKTPWGHTRF